MAIGYLKIQARSRIVDQISVRDYPAADSALLLSGNTAQIRKYGTRCTDDPDLLKQNPAKLSCPSCYHRYRRSLSEQHGRRRQKIPKRVQSGI